jgi:hypothetical protein
LGAGFTNTERSLVESIVDESIPARFTEFVPTGHTNHFIGFKSIFVHAYLAMLAFGGKRASGAVGRISLCHLILSPTTLSTSSRCSSSSITTTFLTTALDTTLLLNLVGIIKE